MSETQQKKWSIRTDDKSREVSFLPVFDINTLAPGQLKNGSNKEIECKFIDVEMKDDQGKTISMRLGFQEMFMFIYFCANEELRQNLLLRYERPVSQIPYEVTFQLTPQEKFEGVAKRLIRLDVDEITMAIARSEAQLLKGKATLGTIEEWFAKKQLSKKKAS